MATVAETISLLSQYNASTADSIAKLAAFLDRIAAINASDPNAMSTYRTLSSELETLRDQLNAKNKVDFDKYTAAYETLTPAQEEQVNTSSAAATFERLVREGEALRTRRIKVLADKLAEINRANPPPTTPTITNTTTTGNAAPTGTNTLQGSASDDSGAQPTTPASTATATATGETSVPGTSSGPSVNAPQPPGAERESTGAANNTQGSPPYPNELFDRRPESANNRPGKRLKNPLSFMSSYNYQLSLYIITPDAYDAFLASGRRDIDVFNENIGNSTEAKKANRKGGAFLLAQSGGAGTDPRAPNVKYDYYIDNLSFKHFSSSEASGAPTGNIEFKFQITEPYGFSFVSNLKKAQQEFDKYSAGASWGTVEEKVTRVPIARQFFILGIRFYGFDEAGVPVTGDETFNGTTLDPNASGSGALFETFYDLTVYNLKYKIDGKATVYDLSGAVTGAYMGANIKKGQINSDKEVSGYTVRDALVGPNGLLTKLNKEQQDLKNNGTIVHPVTYKVNWKGADAERIALATLVSPARTQKSGQPASAAQNTEQVNDETGTRSSPNSNQEKISIGAKPIIQAFDDIFSRSSFVEDALAFNYTDSNEFDPNTKSQPVEGTPKQPFRWYRITPNISNPQWDYITRDWAYDITYMIETYKIPIIDNPYVVKGDRYYGPHKRYEYWYTGENSEVISYTQVLNNQYINEVPAGNPASNNTANNEGNANNTAVVPNTTRSIDLTGAGGGLATAAAGSVKNFLYDPGSYTSAKIQILGDPDFLMQEGEGTEIKTLNQVVDNTWDRFYNTESSNPFSIRPTGGQVFIEIDFKEPVDYSASKQQDVFGDGKGITGVGGTLSINDSILFWDYPPGTRDMIKGISYRLISVDSVFRNGQFTQLLDTVINDFGTGAREGEGSREDIGVGLSDSVREGVGTAENTADQAEAATGTKADTRPGTGKVATASPTATTSVVEAST